MTSLNLASNYIEAEGAKHVAEAIKVNVSTLRFDRHHFEPDLTSGSTAVVYGYSYYNTTKGALASVNILSNDIGAEQANALIKIMESKSNLTTLCGFSGDETELDLSKKGLTAGCAVLVANEIKNNGALTSLNISNNSIERRARDNDGRAPWIATPEGPKALAAAIPKCK